MQVEMKDGTTLRREFDFLAPMSAELLEFLKNPEVKKIVATIPDAGARIGEIAKEFTGVLRDVRDVEVRLTIPGRRSERCVPRGTEEGPDVRR